MIFAKTKTATSASRLKSASAERVPRTVGSNRLAWLIDTNPVHLTKKQGKVQTPCGTKVYTTRNAAVGGGTAVDSQAHSSSNWSPLRYTAEFFAMGKLSQERAERVAAARLWQLYPPSVQEAPQVLFHTRCCSSRVA